jgi:3'-phosphoadenosine 5'-phosphosulfate sulfotransferase (PAPS reductase)/FAD synthetase
MKNPIRPVRVSAAAMQRSAAAMQRSAAPVRKKHIVAFSGGKDSSAMMLRMIEIGMPIDQILFCDTGKEFPQLYKYVKRMNEYTTKKIGVPVTTLVPPTTWDDWFFGKISRGANEGKLRGWPLMAFHCWWSREAKFKMMDPICKGHYRYIGFAADEKKRVEAGSANEGYRFPLADWGWTEKRALEYLKDKGWAEQFHLDFNRTGCYFCPKQKEDSLRILCRRYPEQWDQLMYYAEKANSGENFASHTFTPSMTYEKLKRIEAEERGK